MATWLSLKPKALADLAAALDSPEFDHVERVRELATLDFYIVYHRSPTGQVVATKCLRYVEAEEIMLARGIDKRLPDSRMVGRGT